ncbi:MAG: hypothetical protein KME56_06315 [Candidatus Thiodiazotropha sp. (ex Ctena orbiculata)]|uniref:Nucleoside phosphorylase domain-containing protein n=1 Tax=Candidatus Thiodiazotropha taylori TaxID=2792791 RepID=A0A944MBA4_9GAMM|nr:hypothetical protein [Candidatus Thiodiazotropha taylori]MBT2988257.1 hypothetical protein [Candidatus Thiodiazotropha taylori]MBT2996225.1 hypothetical protein [Candidatus Thiodiazotropha taylori]MBT2999629.1 hypothetical protein [Candidatus Thiodiazotropha taylori]MBT3026580.1 hypothetical protein [Candidatus Thiodiazotropha taylori]
MPLYSADAVRLVITGPGATAAAQGVRYVHDVRPHSHAHWINIGICGHGTLAVGTPILVDRIVDVQGGGEWSLPLTHPLFNCVGPLACVPQPQAEYEAEMAYDMESCGFIEAVTAINSLTSATVMKIVSDNPDNDVQQISGKYVRRLVQQHLGLIRSLIDSPQSNDSYPVPQ